MILVTGATGNLGQAVVNQLSQILPKEQFVGLVRNPEKATEVLDNNIPIRFGDFNQPESLELAFHGIDKLLLISTMEQNRLEQHKAVIDAAKNAGVKHIFYTGLAIKDIFTSAVKDLMLSHFETEEYIIQSGLTYTFLRNTMYAEALPQILLASLKEDKIMIPAGDGKVPFALRQELGEGIANLLTQEGHENKIYHLTGSSAYSISDVVATLNDVKEANYTYQSVDSQIYIDHLASVGFPEFAIYLHQGTVEDIKNGQYDFTTETLSCALGRPSANINEFIKNVF